MSGSEAVRLASPRPSPGADSKRSPVKKSHELICFEHCDQKIFALDSPPVACPGGCETPLVQCHFRIPPFSVPSPFSRAGDYPCSIVIKPTVGSFLDDYSPGDNLHIAVTSSVGDVVEFDENGIHSHRTSSWDKCLVVNLLSGHIVDPDVVQDPDWGEYWDWSLEATVRSTKLQWEAEAYDEELHNCFAFVLAFLRSLRQSPFSDWAEDKVEFCRHLVLPKARVATKYIGLYRKLQEAENHVLAVPLKARSKAPPTEEAECKSSTGQSSASSSSESDDRDLESNAEHEAANANESVRSESASGSEAPATQQPQQQEQRVNGVVRQSSSSSSSSSSEVEDF